jgi:hypothetical protein
MAKRKMEKSYLDLKLKKEMKRKFKTTKIASLVLIDQHDHSLEYKFSELYDYKESLGAGSFGFVVSAVDRETE